MPRVLRGKIRSKVANQRVQRLRAKELGSVLPLFGANEGRVGDDLESGRLERLVQLAEALVLAVLEEAVEIISGGGLVGELINIMMESLRVLDGRGNGIVLIMQLGEEVVPLQPKLPVRPAPTRIVRRVVHLGQSALERPSI